MSELQDETGIDAEVTVPAASTRLHGPSGRTWTLAALETTPQRQTLKRPIPKVLR